MTAGLMAVVATLAMSWIDNLVRPLVISGVARLPFLLVLFGVVGDWRPSGSSACSLGR